MAIATKFADNGTSVSVLTFDEDRINDKLEPSVYSVGFSMDQGFFLIKKSERMTVPTKLYGAVGNRADKVLNTYKTKDKSFGVLMSGDKGSGKTMLSSLIANKCIDELNIPVILVESAFSPSGLSSFIERLGECVVFFDEFGKKFDTDDDEQGGLLGLFDGTGSTKRMVLLTENEKRDINRFMLNRPGRVWYHFEYGKLEEATLKEYCEENNIPEDVVEKINMRRIKAFDFSFDILQAIVTEYQLYGGDVEELCDDLNVEAIYTPAKPKLEILEVTELSTGEALTVVDRDYDFPSSDESVRVNVLKNGKAAEEEDDDFTSILRSNDSVRLEMKALTKIENGIYTFVVERYSDDEKVLVRVCKKNESSAY